MIVKKTAEKTSSHMKSIEAAFVPNEHQQRGHDAGRKFAHVSINYGTLILHVKTIEHCGELRD
jgi:hypothetical protein